MRCLISAGETHKKEWSGENYHHYSHIQYRLAKNLLQQCVFKGNEKILDLGCGDGKITKEIADQVRDGHVVGLDYSESMIAFAKNTYPSTIYTNLQFEQKDAAVLSHIEEFDIVFSFCSLHWMQDQLTVLKNIYRSIKPNGHFLAIIPHAFYLDLATQTTIKKEFWRGYFVSYVHPTRNYELAEYDLLLKSANFPPHSVRMKNTTMVFEEKTELHKWLQQLLPHLHYIPVDSQDQFIDQVIDTLLLLLPHAVQPSGALHIPLPVLEVRAQKFI